MKMVNKTVYVTPSTSRCVVEVESNICSGSVDTTNERGIKSHEGNNDFGAGGFADSGWETQS